MDRQALHTTNASCINMGMFDKKTVRAAVFEIEDTNIVCESMVGGRGMYEVCAQMTDTQCRYVVVRLKTMGLRRESLTVVLLWTPEHAMLAERVLYRKQLRGFCAQLRHVDHVVEMTDWSQFSRSWILARISESQKGA
ncbi:hypothetical protein IWW52_000186 [Coemansia sp. RSA 2704]|nr:hypothetical protein IWW52_000186 [Coemansia sp. RSA 2704]